MPPRFAYWTILAGGLPTSFRAADRDELMPTFRRLKEKHPDAEMKYFARGKLWDSPDDARRDREREERAARSPEWRPGGEHRDPRQRFKDAKKARNEERRRERWQRKQTPERPAPPKTRPHGDPLAPRPERRTRIEGSRHGDARRPFKQRPKPAVGARRTGGGAKTNWSERGPRRESAKPRDREPHRGFRSSSERRFARNQEPPPPPAVPRPDREPPPGREPKPEPPPRPSEPTIKPPGPPERGRGEHRSRGRDRSKE